MNDRKAYLGELKSFCQKGGSTFSDTQKSANSIAKVPEKDKLALPTSQEKSRELICELHERKDPALLDGDSTWKNNKNLTPQFANEQKMYQPDCVWLHPLGRKEAEWALT